MHNRSLALSLAALALGMLMLAYASAPLYDLFCRLTGYGGTTARSAEGFPAEALDRTVTIRFNADIARDLPWQFAPVQREMTVRIGERALAFYTARNMLDVPVKGNAVYNVTPFKAGPYFNKIECFCFQEQTLQPKQEVRMPVSFFVDPAILKDLDAADTHTITLSYTFYPIKEKSVRD